MARVVFTSNLQRHLDAPEVDVEAESVGQALQAVFRSYPRLGGYILDEQGDVRRHVVIFLDGNQAGLESRIRPDSEIYVMQALSGGSRAGREV
ncbi:MAG TPA: MoaD/ThiS family protein [Acidobacteriota bacterium]|nr:MoaD/ThiS family protein [Acidobacteriota bacterium]